MNTKTKTIPLTQPSPTGRGKRDANGIEVVERGPMNCEARRHCVIRNLIAAMPPHVALSCHCETCGQEWYETYARTSMRQ